MVIAGDQAVIMAASAAATTAAGTTVAASAAGVEAVGTTADDLTDGPPGARSPGAQSARSPGARSPGPGYAGDARGTATGVFGPGDGDVRPSGFEVHLDVFEGPFDLLLALISKHKLDITEVALSQVTDEFIGYIRERSGGWDLDQVSYFLVVAATLLDLKAARLLPSGEVEDEEDLALLEARDLLFARLLQYRAYKEAAAVFAGRMAVAARRFPRRVPLEPRFAQLFPEVLLGLGPVEFARIAARVLTPRQAPTVSTDHIHAPFVSVREQARRLAVKLRELRRASFRQLTADCTATYEVVASFLAVLELYREDRISLEQLTPLGDIYVTWNAVGDDDDDVVIDVDEDDSRDVDEDDAQT